MYIENINGMTVLNADFGYIIHSKKTDTFSYKVYLGKYASLDDFEQVDDDSVMPSLKREVAMLEEKNKSLNKIGKIVANEVKNDQVALSIMEFYEEWVEGVDLEVDKYVQYEGRLYKVIQAHRTQSNWTPDITPSLYTLINKEHSGTLDDPIPWNTNMECFEGKYYTEDDILYLCIRDSGIALHYEIKYLIGTYFQVV